MRVTAWPDGPIAWRRADRTVLSMNGNYTERTATADPSEVYHFVPSESSMMTQVRH